MKDKKINSPVILVAPMDWGLGHATRCIPVITKLLAYKCDVIIAASGNGRLLLQKEFPGLLCLDLRGYNIRYAQKRKAFSFALLAQFPKITSVIYTEHKWLKKVVKKYSIDMIISDNRMGMFHAAVPSVYITHQLQIKTGNRLTEWFAKKIHYWFINKFNECWVPDNLGKINLAGDLSHPALLPGVPVKYIGPLSRFEKYPVERKYDVAFILSGPEPQRTVFEDLVLKDIEHFDGSILLVRGLPESIPLKTYNNASLEIHDYLGAEDLNRAILQSGLIISRCGYSTVMDLVKLQKKAVLVPTPGQTEQEYLAEYLSQGKLFCCIKQESFSFPGVLKTAEAFSFNEAVFAKEDYGAVLKEFLTCIRRDQ